MIHFFLDHATKISSSTKNFIFKGSYPSLHNFREMFLLLHKFKHFSLSARVGEKSNYLEVESNKFLKFRQDYTELGKLVSGITR